MPDTSVTIPSHEPPVQPSRLARKAVEIARRELGQGEEGGNNQGPAVVKYRRGVGGEKAKGAWCAAFISWCFEEAATALGEPLPFKRSMGAKRLFKNAYKAGERLGPEDMPRAGDIVCWDRGKKGSWQGHVGIVISAHGSSFITIEGNRGIYPSRVKTYEHELGEGRLMGFARI